MLSLGSKTLTISYSPGLRKVWYVAVLLFAIAMIAFSLFYLFSGYDTLKQWYYSLNNCFPGHDTWADKFFTLSVKSKGNTFSLIGIFFSLFMIISIISSWKKLKGIPTQKQEINITEWWWYGAVKVLAIALAIWSWSLVAPAYDEIYSAVNCAELHPFQTISYYSLPNNHIYFNLANNLFFSWYIDHVYSGRFISLIAYVCVLLCVFRWLSGVITHKWLAFISLLPIALQFTAWGFAGQARGYEAQLFCGWAAFITMLLYIRTGNKNPLRLNTIANIIGFALIPSYLFWYIAQLLAMICAQASQKRFVRSFWKHQALMTAGVFLLYLPAFCFSGLAAFTDNKYVAPSGKSFTAFLPDLISYFKGVVNYCFSIPGGSGYYTGYIFFCLPALLLFSVKKERRFLSFFYILSWAVFLCMSLYMRHIAFYRNLIVQYSITMACLVYTLYVIAFFIIERLKLTKFRNVSLTLIFALPILLFSAHLIKHDRSDISMNLYFNDVNGTYNIHKADIAAIPQGSSVACSDASFYFYYYCHKLHYNTSRCPRGNEDYFITRPDELLPAWVITNYVLFRTCEEDYNIYKRK